MIWTHSVIVAIMVELLLLLYVGDLLQLVKWHQLVPRAVADDTYRQIYGFCRPCDVIKLSDIMSAWADEFLSWMRANQLQANPSKTEVLWCSLSRR